MKRGSANGVSPRSRPGSADQATSHNALLRPYYLQLHADLLLQSNRVDEADAALEAARSVGRTTDQQMFAAEWHRLRGQILLAKNAANLDEAQAAFDDAMEVARWQGAKLFESRAREALAKLAAHRDTRQSPAPPEHYGVRKLQIAD